MNGGRSHTPTRRRLLAAGESVAAAGLLAACGGLLQPGGRASGTTPRKAVTLEYWSRFGVPIQAVEEKNLPLFMQKFAPIQVERTTITGGSTGLIEKITTAFASNTAPDLFTMGSRNVVTYAHPGSVLSLDSLPRVRREEQDFFGPPQAVARYRAKLYGMTYFIDSRQPIYRKDLLAGAGLPTDRKQLPKTWEQFRETAKKLARWEGGQLARAGFNVSKSGSDVFNHLQNPLLRPFYEALAYGWSVPQHPRFDEMFNRIVANNSDAVAQKKSVREALADSVGYCNALLAGG